MQDFLLTWAHFGFNFEKVGNQVRTHNGTRVGTHNPIGPNMTPPNCSAVARLHSGAEARFEYNWEGQLSFLRFWAASPESTCLIGQFRSNMTPLNATFLSPLILGLVYCIYKKVRGKGPYSRLPLPPGPKRLPLVGNLWNLPDKFEWETYHKWCKELNTDILYLNLAGTNVVVLDTYEAASDLLEKRSSIYSGRPQQIMAGELIGWEFSTGLLPYGEKWRKHRKLMHSAFHSTSFAQFKPDFLCASRNLLNRILDYPDDIIANIRHMAGETIMSITYGINALPKNDPYIETAERSLRTLDAVVPGAFLVDSFPWLKYIPKFLPGAGFKRKAREWHKLTRMMVENPYKAAMRDMDAGMEHSGPSFLTIGLGFMRASEEEGWITEDDVQDGAGTVYTAGTDTTVATLASCILGLLDRPDVLQKAQIEIDRVVRPGHLPEFEDEPSLPYITAIVKESLRWFAVVPTAIPHLLEVEDEYKGYRLPAGTIVMGNSWAMLNDEKVYLDPSTFNPDRFMRDGELNHEIRMLGLWKTVGISPMISNH
ncbi:unnamed protein product [Cyclocybe aegerita]|uniref:Cytochrome P450 n=1 Tax=Cyclocybe aegerita TaxID=1973307 RepID=A0A8S0W896_CYCAE|nr:unnamed protein product [Cyclocybe aegerita]